ncbi:MAG TPA: hypothetical protein PKG77_19515 [Phycisphaerae bacterium]|nr:hypothetical protein [Phycisphaerae bacterium]HQL75967.1 hypothetical protein [Phycisphaerae bacterium]
MQLLEHVESREYSSDSITFHYVLRGTSSDQLAWTTLLASTATKYNGMVREKRPSMKPIWVDTIAGDGDWECTVRYCLPDKVESEVGTVRIQWSTKGGNQHATQSIATIARYAPAGKTPTDHKGAIGYNGENVEGVDLPAPVFNFQVTKRFAEGGLPPLGTIYSLTAKVNNAQFSVTDTVTGQTITLNAGECLFEGAESGQAGEDGSMDYVYSFSASPNKANFAVGDITVTAKKGWEYLWVEYADSEDSAAKRICKRPIGAHVEKVFELGNFAGLGL